MLGGTCEVTAFSEPPHRKRVATYSPVRPSSDSRMRSAWPAESAAGDGETLQAQRERGAARNRSTCVREHRRRDGAGTDDRVPPIVELDHLGHEVGTHAVTVALDAIDGECVAITHDAAATAPTTPQRRSCSWS